MVQLNNLTRFVAKYARDHQFADRRLQVVSAKQASLAAAAQGASEYLVRQRLAPYQAKVNEAMRLFSERFPDMKVERYESAEVFDFYVWWNDQRYMRVIGEIFEVNNMVDEDGNWNYIARKMMPACWSKGNPNSEDLAYYRSWLAIATDVVEGDAEWVAVAMEAALLDRSIKDAISREGLRDETSMLYKALQDATDAKTKSQLAIVVDFVLSTDNDDKVFWKDVAHALFNSSVNKGASKKVLERYREELLA